MESGRKKVLQGGDYGWGRAIDNGLWNIRGEREENLGAEGLRADVRHAYSKLL